MKSLIVPIALIVALIVCFIIVDRKDLNHHDEMSFKTNQADHPESGIKTATDSDSVSTFRVKEEQATATKSVSVTNSEEMNPVTVQIPEGEGEASKDEKLPQNKAKNAAPFVVPVVSLEESKKTNVDAEEYAVAEKEKREPFFSFYEGDELEPVSVEGTIRATSTIPNPEKNDYDNCLFAVFLEIQSIQYNSNQSNKILSEAIITVPIMKDKTIIEQNWFVPGDKVSCICADYSNMPQDIQEIQLSDDIQSYEHQQYYAIDIHKISKFQTTGIQDFSKREITILPIQTLPRDDRAFSLRKERIQKEIKRIEEDIKKHGGSFPAWKEEYKAISEKYKELCNAGYKGWINNS